MGDKDPKSSEIPDSEPPPYVRTTAPFNLGLHELAQMDQVFLEQSDSFLSGKYVVLNAEREVIFYAKEESTTPAVELGDKDRAFRIDLFDERDQRAFTLRRDIRRFKKKKMQVFVGEKLVSKVRLKSSYFSRLLHINDVNDRVALTLSGPMTMTGMGKYTFDLLGLTNEPIGSITKLYRGLRNELRSAGHYEVRFPADLDVRYKVAVIGTCILIDIHYYSFYIGDSRR